MPSKRFIGKARKAIRGKVLTKVMNLDFLKVFGSFVVGAVYDESSPFERFASTQKVWFIVSEIHGFCDNLSLAGFWCFV